MNTFSKKRIPALLTFFKRLILSTIAVAGFFVLTQDIQIFPGILTGIFSGPNSIHDSIPPDIKSSFVATKDNETIEVWKLPAKDERAYAILFHGNADTLLSTYSIQRWLARLGVSSYSFDYRGYGRSSGFPSEEGIYLDAEAVYQFARDDSKPIILFGVSIGTGAASYLASKIKPEVLILLSPYTSLTDLIGEIPLLGYLTPFLRYSFPVKEYLASLQDSCLILAHGSRDTTIPVHHSKALASLYPFITHIEIQEAGHNDLLSHAAQRISEELTACIQEDIQQGPENE